MESVCQNSGFRMGLRLKGLLFSSFLLALPLAAQTTLPQEPLEKIEFQKANQFATEHYLVALKARDEAKQSKLSSSDKLKTLLSLMQKELKDPSPNIWFPSPYVIAETVQTNLILGLSQIEVSALKAAYDQQKDALLRKRLVIAMGLAKTADDQTSQFILRELSRLVLKDPYEFIRAKAARALGEFVSKRPSLGADATKTLKKALLDQSWRVDRRDVVYKPEPEKVYLVRKEASDALCASLNFKRSTVHEWSTNGKEYAPLKESEYSDAPPLPYDPFKWVTARKRLSVSGYRLTWKPASQELIAKREHVIIRVKANQKSATINDKRFTLTDAPVLVDGVLLIPETFAVWMP